MLLSAALQDLPDQPEALVRARAFAQPLLVDVTLDTGEDALSHADAMTSILRQIGGSEALQAACFLVYAVEHLHKPDEVIAKGFGSGFAELAVETARLIRVQRQARAVAAESQHAAMQTENVRKMLLAFSRDLRVVLLRLASRLQTLRYFAAFKKPVPQDLAYESLHIFAPLANRLGIWQIKWEMEDLSFRFLEPTTYHEIAHLLDGKRAEREHYMTQLRDRLEADLLVHVVDISNPNYEKQMQSVKETLHSIGASNKPELIVFNKVDAFKGKEDDFFVGDTGLTIVQFEKSWMAKENAPAVFISATNKTNVEKLRSSVITELLKTKI
jgi:GTP pyrophosphokinase